jgi:hypothetical protein
MIELNFNFVSGFPTGEPPLFLTGWLGSWATGRANFRSPENGQGSPAHLQANPLELVDSRLGNCSHLGGSSEFPP